MVRVVCSEVPVAELRKDEWFRRILAVWDRWRGDRFAPRWHVPDMVELPSAMLCKGDDGEPIFQDTLRLPLSDDGETVTEVLSYADWRSRHKQWQRVFEAL